MYRQCALALVVLLASACSSTPSPLINVKWIATEIHGQPVVEGARSWLEVADDGSVAGHGGCNRYSGKAKVGATDLKFGAVAATKMACANPGSMEQETRLFAALDATRTYRMEGQDVLLLDETGKVQARFQPQTQ